MVSLDKQTLKSEILFHEKELFTHNYNTLLLDSKIDYGLPPMRVVLPIYLMNTGLKLIK